jgi:hypothetical protein
MDTFSIISNILSITLSVVSLCLSIYYYTQSNKVNKDNERISNDIRNSVNKLESLFEKLYSDTFSMLKEQNNTMQNAFLQNNVSNSASTSIDPEHTIIAKIVEHKKITIESLCKQCNTIKPNEVKSIVSNLSNNGTILIQDDLIVFAISTSANNSSQS